MAAIDPLPEPLRSPRVAIENPSLEIQAAESSQSGLVSGPTVAVPDDVEHVTVQKPTSTKTVHIKHLKKNTELYYMKRKEKTTFMFNVFSVPRTTAWRRRKAKALRLETEKAKAQGTKDWPLTVLRSNVLPQ